MGSRARSGRETALLSRRGRALSVPLLVVAAVLLASCQGRGATLAATGVDARTMRARAPTAEVIALAGSMSDEGKRIYFAATPKVVDRDQLGVVCPATEADEQIFGCYVDEKIYILRVARPELARVMEVTAAHEMLHAAYASLPTAERRRVDGLVDALYERTNDPILRQLIADYERTDPGSRPDELHSILPTQLPALDPPLDTYYGRYFAARLRVIEAYQASEGVLDALDRRIDGLNTEVERLDAQIKALDAQVTAEEKVVDDLDAQLSALNAKGNRRDFERLLPQREAKARSLEKLIDQYNKLVDVYNAKVEEIDGLALKQSQLIDTLDEKASP